MKTTSKRIVFTLALLAMLAVACISHAEILPNRITNPGSRDIYGTACMDIAMNDGPGTRRYFNELGTYRVDGENLKIVAKAWDPNNGIWWVKVECSRGTGHYGWTGYKRFYAWSFDLDKVPTEYWYSY